MTPEQLNDLRQRVLRGETVPPEDLRAAINAIRGARIAGATAAAEKANTPRAAAKPGGRLAGVDLASIIAGAMKKA